MRPDDVLHGSCRRLNELPVDADDAVFAAGAPHLLLLAKLDMPRLHAKLLRVASSKARRISERSFAQPDVKGQDKVSFAIGLGELAGNLNVEATPAFDPHIAHSRR